MILDIRTLLISNFLYTLLIAVSFAISYGGFSGQIRSSIKTLSNGMFLMSAGWLFLGLRGFIPDFHSVLWGNLAAVLGLVEIYNTIRVFDGKTTRRKFLYPLALLFIAANMFFLNVINIVSVRIFIISLSSAVFAVFAASALYIKPTYESKIRVLSAIAFLLLAIFSLARAVDSLFFNFGKYSLLSNTLLQTIYLIAIFLAIFMMTFAFILMCIHRFNDELKKTVIIDPLTNLYNRIGIKQYLQNKIQQSISLGQPMCAAIFDINEFRSFNDQYGLEAGDAALQIIANIIQSHSKTGDIAGRLGGDEFVLILTQTQLAAGMKVAADIASEIAKNEHTFNQQPLQFSISFGVAMLNMENPDANQLIRDAHHELFKARTFSEDTYGT